PLRGLPADARPPAHGGRLGRDGLASGRGPRDRPQLGADAGVPPDALREDRAEREASRAAHALRARAFRRARHPALRARGALGLTAALRRIAPWAVTLAIFAFLFWRIPFGRVAETLASARWGYYLLLMAPYSLFYCLVDSLAVQQAVAW